MARTQAKSRPALHRAAKQFPSRASLRRRGRKSRSAPANSNSLRSKLRLQRLSGRHPPLPHAKFPAPPPSLQRLAAPLPAYMFRVCVPIARRQKISMRQPPQAPNTRPGYALQQNPAPILFLPPRETRQPNKSESPVAYLPSASALLPCLQNTSSKWKSQALYRLRQIRRALTQIFPPARVPFPGIATLVLEIRTLLFPLSLYLRESRLTQFRQDSALPARACCKKSLFNLFVHIRSGKARGHANRIFHRVCIRTPMADHANAAHPVQGRPAVLRVVDRLFQTAKRALRQDSCKLRYQRT